MAQHHSELVAANAAHEVGFAGLADQGLANRPQHAVAGSMAVRVVDLLEVVEIEEDQAGLNLVAAHHRDHALGLAHEGPPVVDRHQRIMVGGGFSLAEIVFQLVVFQAQAVHLPHHRLEPGAHLGRHLVGGNAEQARRTRRAVFGLRRGVRVALGLA